MKHKIPPFLKPEVKDTNPKDAIGSGKLPMHLIPGTAKAYMAIAFLEGALKYGKYNWRVAGVRASIYADAMERHLEKWKNGEDCDPQTGVHHLASVMACAAIILDARECRKLTDDRPPRAPASDLIDELAGDVEYLKQLYDNETPHQYTIEDSNGPQKSKPWRDDSESSEKEERDSRADGRVLSEIPRQPRGQEAACSAEQSAPGGDERGEGKEG